MNNRFVTGGLSELQAANRSPIFGYQHLPVVSLEQAMKKLSQSFQESSNIFLLLSKIATELPLC
jgi:hypothetical protein